ncbi:uncharacterized protein LOC134243144 [Saccostrea cucullata]|uniref:uncharacterized protein LOC134243144 n=1 Tax=Saccostrea cuccullata TaxID=36930 RepID=UPI002ED6B748
MSTFIDRRISNYVILLLSRMVAITALMCTSLDIMLGAMLYKYQFKKTASNYASDVNLGYPIDKFELQMGWKLECAAGGLFLMATLIAIAESLHNPPSKDKSSKSVVPFEEKTNSNNNKNKEEEKKENKKGKLVVEDIDENPGKKS